MSYQLFLLNLDVDTPTLFNFINGNFSKKDSNCQNLKKQQIILREILQPLHNFKLKILNNTNEIKISSKIININLSIIVYLSKIKSKLYNQLLFLSLYELKKSKID